MGKCAGSCCILIRERVSETWNCKLMWGQRLSSDLMWKRLLRMTSGQPRDVNEEPRDRLFLIFESKAEMPPLLQTSLHHLTIFPLTLIKADERKTSNCPVPDCHRVWASLCVISLKATGRFFYMCVLHCFFSLPPHVVWLPQLCKSSFLSWRADDDEPTQSPLLWTVRRGTISFSLPETNVLFNLMKVI